MYENYTRQSLPSREYRQLLGSAICVFSSNTGFIIEILLKINPTLSWYDLIDKTSERLQKVIDKTIKEVDLSICDDYRELTKKRNRIVHSFRITNNYNQQSLATKTKSPENTQFEITEEFLLEFINDNQKFSDKLYNLRAHIENGSNN